MCVRTGVRSRTIYSLIRTVFIGSLAGQTLTWVGESLVKLSSDFGVAYSAAGYLMK